MVRLSVYKHVLLLLRRFRLVAAAALAFALLSSLSPAAAAPLPPAKARRPVAFPATPKASGGSRTFAVCPVDPPRRYLPNDFGAPRYFGGYHPHQGEDIFAARGTPVRAPFDGLVRSSDSSAGGLAVYVEGKKGFVYNAHLTSLGKLGRVSAGTIVGYVGNTGDAQGASPHDHFEWHPGGGAAVDPYPFLQEACAARPRPDPIRPNPGRFRLGTLR